MTRRVLGAIFSVILFGLFAASVSAQAPVLQLAGFDTTSPQCAACVGQYDQCSAKYNHNPLMAIRCRGAYGGCVRANSCNQADCTSCRANYGVCVKHAEAVTQSGLRHAFLVRCDNDQGSCLRNAYCK